MVTGAAVTLGGTPVVIHTREAVHPPSGLLGLDVESTYMTDRGQFDPDFRVRTVQIATVDEAWVFDLSNRAERTMAEACFIDDRVAFCSHTNMDVLAVHREFGIDLTDRNIDTHGLAIMADPDKFADRDLKSLATAYGMPELAAADGELYEWMFSEWIECGGKKNAAKKAIEAFGWDRLAGMGANFWPEVFTRYAGLDAIACRRLVELLLPVTSAPAELLDRELWLDGATNRIQIRGMRVDVPRLSAALDEVRNITEGSKKAAEAVTGGVNINGPKVKDWFAEHGADWSTWPGARTKTGPSFAKENLALVGDYPLDDGARSVLFHMKEHAKHLDLLRKTEQIADRMVEERIHPNINPRGATTTARMSSSGPNVQNFSKKDARHRGLFLPDPGHELWTIDFAQVELRVVAALAREEKMIETILSGGDLHQLTVDELAAAGVTITRQQAKVVNFLIVYGGGKQALHDQTGIPIEEAGTIINAWRERYKAISVLAQYLGTKRDGIRTISNRWLPATKDEHGNIRAYANINYAVQSAARELLVDAWWRFEEEFGHRGIVWLPIHDELVLQVPEGEAETIIPDAERAMTMEFRGVPITAEAIKLVDEEGISRWMPGDIAEKIAATRQEKSL